MSTKTSESLLTQLLLKHPNATPEEYQEFYGKIIQHRFARMLHLYDIDKEIPQMEDEIRTLPAEREISSLLNNSHPDLFLKNIMYHLRRNKRVLPPALLPIVLTQTKNHPDLWVEIYHQHPKLVLALLNDSKQWNDIKHVLDPDITLEIGSPGYYESLKSRMQIMPLQTSIYIREIYLEKSMNQQARLLEILHEDHSFETSQFITSQVNHSRKPVRLAALKSCMLRKEPLLYDPIKNSLVNYIQNPGEELKSEQWLAPWNDLSSLCDESTKEKTLIALTDPDEYLDVEKTSFLNEHRSAIQKAAIFHRSQNTILNLLTNSPATIHEPNMEAAVDSNTASRLMNIFTSNPSVAVDLFFIILLKRVHPFLNEADSDLLWKKCVQQWADLPFTLEELPLEVLALRIHPNCIKLVWQHPLLQETAPVLQKFREILKNRLAFLKKCYKD